MKRLFLIFLFLLIACPAWGATYYVSGTESNGYQIGQDINNCTAKATPCLTVYAAYTKAATTGDTIIVNDGTYDMADGGNANAYLQIQKGITLSPETTQGATLKCTTGGGLILYIKPSSGQTVSIGAFIFDNQSIATMGSIYFNPLSTGSTTTINGASFINQGRYAFYTIPVPSYAYTLSISNISISGSTSGLFGMYFGTIGGAVTLDGISLNMTSSSASATKGIYILGSTTAGTVSVNNITGTVASAKAVYGISIVDVPSAIIDNSNLTVTTVDTTYSVFGYQINASNGHSADGSIIRNSDVHVNGEGYAIIIGDSGVTGTGTANNSKIYNCNAYGVSSGVIGSPHGIVMGNGTTTSSGEVYNNTSTNFNPNYLMAKCGSGVIFHHNKSINSGITTSVNTIDTQILYCKGCNGAKYYNNTVYQSGFAAYAFAARTHSDTTPNSNVEFKNNIVYTDQGSAVFAVVANSNTAIFSNNLYYGTSTLSNSAYYYQGKTYATFALWQAAGYDVNSANSDPLFISNGTNFHLQPGSPARGAGVNVGLSNTNPPDIGAEPYVQYVPWR
jgi:hypothetical protein